MRQRQFCPSAISERCSISPQERYLLAFPELAATLPWNCIQRRNVALLWALDVERADVVITIDDDNAPPEGLSQDFVGALWAARPTSGRS